MNSKIQQVLADVTEVEPSKKRDETITSQDYLKRLAKAVGELPDADWNKLPKDAHDWYNSAVDAAEAKKDLPVFGDLPKDDAPTTTRRRAAAAEEGPYVPTVGDTIKAVTKRGKTVEGKLTEIDGTTLVVKTEDGDEELDTDRLQSIEKVGGKASAAADPGEDDGPADPEVGDTVEVETQRGKKVMGNITEMTDDELVLETAAGDVEEFDRAKLKSVVVKSKNSGSKAPSRATGGSKAGKDDDKPKRTSSKDNGGVSVTVRMRELICDNLAWTKEQVTAAMKKEALEFKPATLDLVFAEAHKLIGMLRERGALKK